MEQIVIQHKDLMKNGFAYLFFAMVLAVMLYVVRDQFVMSLGTLMLLLAFAIELGMAVFMLLRAASREVLDETGITVTCLFGSKTYGWSSLQRFEINWTYEKKKGFKNGEEPFILLSFDNPRMTMKFPYDADLDRCIRCNYGEPELDNWTSVGK